MRICIALFSVLTISLPECRSDGDSMKCYKGMVADYFDGKPLLDYPWLMNTPWKTISYYNIVTRDPPGRIMAAPARNYLQDIASRKFLI
jgi:hypothetical protein